MCNVFCKYNINNDHSELEKKVTRTEYCKCNTQVANVPSVVLLFTDGEMDSWTAPANVTAVEYLVVGGGGGGGGAFDNGSAGGGGGGLVLYGTLSVVPGNTYSIVVGAGGNGGIGIGTVTGVPGSELIVSTGGGVSSFDTIIALGGGGGSNSRTFVGGAGIGGLAANGLTAPTGGNGAGNSGGGQIGGGQIGGGGGGNLTAGVSSTTNHAQANAGGLGFTSNITGSNVTYGKGGVGGIFRTPLAGSDADNNTGNGGGGATAEASNGQTGGNGGSGIVILKYYV
jgi:hypothetical protein